MPLLAPTVYLSRITELTPALLQRLDIHALVLDVDNTLALHGHPTPADGVADWVEEVQAAGISVLILSNNSAKRVAPFANKLGAKWGSRAFKPLPFGLWGACRTLGSTLKTTAMVGDQLFTDVLCGKIARTRTVLVDPIAPEDGPLFRFKRVLETPFRRRFTKEGG